MTMIFNGDDYCFSGYSRSVEQQNADDELWFTTDNNTININDCSSSTVYTPTTTTGGTGGQIYTSPNIIYYPGSSSSAITISSGDTTYSVLEMEREECPTAVYVCGRMVTLGVIGTDVECVYVGDKLIFEPGVVKSIAYEGRLTISIEYKDEIHHYNVGKHGCIQYKNNSPTLDATMVSKIEK